MSAFNLENDDHRGLMEVPIYMVKVNGPTDKKKRSTNERKDYSISKRGSNFSSLEDLVERLLKTLLIHVKN